jgi:hypothetical protein
MLSSWRFTLVNEFLVEDARSAPQRLARDRRAPAGFRLAGSRPGHDGVGFSAWSLFVECEMLSPGGALEALSTKAAAFPRVDCCAAPTRTRIASGFNN